MFFSFESASFFALACARFFVYNVIMEKLNILLAKGRIYESVYELLGDAPSWREGISLTDDGCGGMGVTIYRKAFTLTLCS